MWDRRRFTLTHFEVMDQLEFLRLCSECPLDGRPRGHQGHYEWGGDEKSFCRCQEMNPGFRTHVQLKKNKPIFYILQEIRQIDALRSCRLLTTAYNVFKVRIWNHGANVFVTTYSYRLRFYAKVNKTLWSTHSDQVCWAPVCGNQNIENLMRSKCSIPVQTSTCCDIV